MEPKVLLVNNKEALQAALDAFLQTLPSDTKSVQMALYAYDATYDGYDEKKTKCVAEGDTWLILDEQARMELLGQAVTAALHAAAEVLSMADSRGADDSEEEAEALNLLEDVFRPQIRSLARSFARSIDNVDTGAHTQVQLKRLFSGLIAHNNRVIFNMAVAAFKRKEALAEPLEEILWRLMSEERAPKKTLGKPGVPDVKAGPGGKAATSAAISKPIKPATTEAE